MVGGVCLVGVGGRRSLSGRSRWWEEFAWC